MRKVIILLAAIAITSAGVLAAVPDSGQHQTVEKGEKHK